MHRNPDHLRCTGIGLLVRHDGHRNSSDLWRQLCVLLRLLDPPRVNAVLIFMCVVTNLVNISYGARGHGDLEHWKCVLRAYSRVLILDLTGNLVRSSALAGRKRGNKNGSSPLLLKTLASVSTHRGLVPGSIVPVGESGAAHLIVPSCTRGNTGSTADFAGNWNTLLMQFLVPDMRQRIVEELHPVAGARTRFSRGKDAPSHHERDGRWRIQVRIHGGCRVRGDRHLVRVGDFAWRTGPARWE